MKWLLNLSGAARALLMFVAGSGAALSLAPFFLWPLLPVSYGLLLHYLLRAGQARAGFAIGWCWGFGFFLAGLYWISISMTVDLARFGWMIPFALLGMNGGLALFPALACWMFVRLRHSRACLNWLLFSLLLFASEWLRGHILTGFPWNLIGYSWGASDASIQIASLLPIYPLTFITIVLASSAALWHKRWPVLASVAVFACMLGFAREQLKAAASFEAPFSARLVQANITQNLKNDRAFANEAFAKHVQLSQGSDADYIIWAESALPYPIVTHEPFAAHAFSWLKEGQTLLSGAVVIDEDGSASNSIVALSRGAMLARYDKQHLVPFGEYVPLRGILPIEKLTPGIGDFARGQGGRHLPEQFHPLICYEVIFPSYAHGTQPVLLNLTNDGWFGDSSGPHQHLTMARFRAVEQAKPLIRVANTGISAVIDAHGRVQDSLALNESGFIELEKARP